VSHLPDAPSIVAAGCIATLVTMLVANWLGDL
jgi:hypothetical protein